VRCEIAKLFGVLPIQLKQLPLSEFQIMYRFWMREVKSIQKANDRFTSEGDPKDGDILE
jgi:hypothetical protein